MISIFALLIVYQIKHFLADFPLQGEYMLRKFHKDPNVWVPSLALHAGVHALFTWIIAQWAQMAMYPQVNINLSAALAVLDFVTHFTMDRIKASPNMMGRFRPLTAENFANMKNVLEFTKNPITVDATVARQGAIRRIRSNTFFWWSLGFDQMIHHLTHYAIIYVLVTQ